MMNRVLEQIDSELRSAQESDVDLWDLLYSLHGIDEPKSSALLGHFERTLDFPQRRMLVRALSFFVARHLRDAVSLDRVFCYLPLRWLLENPQRSDASSLVNTLDATHRAICELEKVPEILTTSTGSFLLYALGSDCTAVAFAALQILTLIIDLDLCSQVFSKAIANDVIDATTALRSVAEEDESEEISRIAQFLGDAQLRPSLEGATRACQQAVAALSTRGDLSVGLVREYAELCVSVEDAISKSQSMSRPFLDVRFAHGSRKQAGEPVYLSMPLAERLFACIGTLAGDDPVRAYPAVIGSYVQRFVMDDAAMLQRVFDQLASLADAALARNGGSAVEGLSHEAVVCYAGLLRVTRDEGLSLTFSLVNSSESDPSRVISGGAEMPISAASLEASLKTVSSLDSSQVPQADDLHQVLKVALAVVSEGLDKTALGAKFGLGLRNVNYYLAAARILGLLDAANEPTRRAMAITGVSQAEMLRAVAVYFEDSKVCREWLRWASVSRLSDLDPGSASAFLTARLSGDTATRRSKTLRGWLQTVQPYHYCSKPGQLDIPGTVVTPTVRPKKP